MVHPIEYHSNVTRRLCRSTLQSETLCMVHCYGEAEHLRSVLHGLRRDHQSYDWKVRAMDSIRIYHSTTSLIAEALKHTCIKEVPMCHRMQPPIETKAMVADCLTKKMKSEQMEVLRCEGTLAFDMNKENSKKAMAKACSMGNRNEMSISGLKKTMDVETEHLTWLYSIHSAQTRMNILPSEYVACPTAKSVFFAPLHRSALHMVSNCICANFCSLTNSSQDSFHREHTRVLEGHFPTNSVCD